MNGWIVVGIIVGLIALGFLAQRLGIIDLRDKSRTGGSGSMSGAFGSLDEVFAPTRHEAQQEIDRQAILPAPAPVAGDGDKGVYGGTVRIDLSAK